MGMLAFDEVVAARCGFFCKYRVIDSDPRGTRECRHREHLQHHDGRRVPEGRDPCPDGVADDSPYSTRRPPISWT